MLLIGRRIRKVLCKLIAIRQTCILRKLSGGLKMNLLARASEDATGRSHRVVRAVLRNLSPTIFEESGISVESSFCFRELQARGCVISGFGQLEPADQTKIQEVGQQMLLPPNVSLNSATPTATSEDVFDRLVLWCRQHPGEYFENNKMRHFEVMLAGMWSDKVVLVKRSAMERMTLARYFAFTWKRTAPLWAVFGADKVELRSAEQPEASRVRVNECPYATLHGMSLPAGGF